MKTLRLYSRPGCSLCEDLEDQLHAQFAGRYRLDWRHVDREPDARQRFSDKIPVLLSEQGEVLSQGSLDRARLADYLN